MVVNSVIDRGTSQKDKWGTRAEEGELVRMLSRAGEALMQIASLKTAHPAAARTAATAAEIVLREPVR